MATILKNTCVQCSSEIPLNRKGFSGSRGPKQRYCVPCRAQRNRERVVLWHARRRARLGITKQNRGRPDSAIFEAHYKDVKLAAALALCRSCKTPLGAHIAKADFCAPCAQKRNEISLRKCRANRKRIEGGSDLDPYAVFTRDGWRCYLCGIDTPRELRGTQLPNAPELEHKTPLSRGGGHTLENTACSCHSCNAAKNSKTLEEYLAWLANKESTA